MPAPSIETIHLDEGAHSSPDDGMCVMEAVAFVAGEPFSDHPACASPILGSFLRSWNDSLSDDDRQMLKPFVPRLVAACEPLIQARFAETTGVLQKSALILLDRMIEVSNAA